jgi:hypothetical protein
MAAFRGEVSFVLNNTNIRICDCLMVFLRREAEESVVQRHTETTNMLRLLTKLCQRPGDVSAWSYSVQQSTWLFERLGPVDGADRVGQIKVHHSEHAPSSVGPVVDSPILFPLLCALLSPDLLLIPLARMLAVSRRGRWTADDKTFVLQRSARGREAMGPLWVIVSEDLGTVRVVARGNHIQWVELDNPWPAVQRPSGSQFLPQQCRLELVCQHADPVKRSGLINVPAHDGAYITMAIDAWERWLGSLSLELRSPLEGTYVISRFGQPFRPFFLEKPPVLRRRCHGGAWPTVAKCFGRVSWSTARGITRHRGVLLRVAQYQSRAHRGSA